MGVCLSVIECLVSSELRVISQHISCTRDIARGHNFFHFAVPCVLLSVAKTLVAQLKILHCNLNTTQILNCYIAISAHDSCFRIHIAR